VLAPWLKCVRLMTYLLSPIWPEQLRGPYVILQVGLRSSLPVMTVVLPWFCKLQKAQTGCP
jgi:hypothetical protein